MMSFKQHLLHEAVKPRREYTLAGKNILVKLNTGDKIKLKVAQSRYYLADGKITYVHAFAKIIAGIGSIEIDANNVVTFPSFVKSFTVIN
jgi:hypothetical protein